MSLLCNPFLMFGGGAAGGTDTRSSLQWGVDKPTTSNTGVLSGVTRTTYTGGNESSLPSGTYSNLNFTSGEINLINGRTYVFYNCMFASSGRTARLIDATGFYTGSASFTDCSFIPDWTGLDHTNSTTAGGHGVAALGIRGINFTALRCQFLGCNDGIGVGGVGTYSGASNVLIQQCYIADFAFWRPDQNGRTEGTHNDGIAVDGGGTGTRIYGNTIVGFNDPDIGDAGDSEYTSGGVVHGLNPGDDPEQWVQGAPIFVRILTGSVVDHVDIQGNWATGGQVNINVSDSGGTITGITVKNNTGLGNDSTVDKGRYNKNMWIGSDSYAARTDVSGNTQVNGNAVTVASGRIQLT